jgi:pilus assembly protein CpaE
MSAEQRLLAVGVDTDLLSQLQAAATRVGNLTVAATGDTSDELAGADAAFASVCAAAEADWERIRRLLASLGATPLVVFAPRASGAEVRRLFRMGARDVLTGALDPETLQASLGDLLRPKHGGVGRGRVVCLMKGCGGAGATTLALNLAAFATPSQGADHGAGACVLDLDLQFGDTDLGLDLQPRTSVVDLIRAEGRMDQRLLDSVLVEHPSGLRLLAPAPTLTPLEALTAEAALDIVGYSAGEFARVFVDLPGAWTDWTLPLAARADLLVVVTAPSVAGVIGARRVLEALRAAEVATPALLVVNRLVGTLEGFEKPAQIERALGRSVDAALPYDAAAVRAADAGRLVTVAFPKSAVARRLREVSARIERQLREAEAPGQLEGAA